MSIFSSIGHAIMGGAKDLLGSVADVGKSMLGGLTGSNINPTDVSRQADPWQVHRGAAGDKLWNLVDRTNGASGAQTWLHNAAGLLRDPSSIFSNPLFTQLAGQGTEAIKRSAAASGTYGSGAMFSGIGDWMSNFANQMLQQFVGNDLTMAQAQEQVYGGQFGRLADIAGATGSGAYGAQLGLGALQSKNEASSGLFGGIMGGSGGGLGGIVKSIGGLIGL